MIFFLVGLFFIFSYSCSHPTVAICNVEDTSFIQKTFTQIDTFPWNSRDSIRFDYFQEGDSLTIPFSLFKKARDKYPKFGEDISTSFESVFTIKCNDNLDEYDNELENYQNIIYTFMMRRKNNSLHHWESRVKLLS